MADYQRNIEAELEQVALAIAKLPQGSLAELSELELSGVGGILQSIYNGIENILKQLFLAHDKPIPSGLQWHQQVVRQATQYGFISESTADELAPYLTFRHLYRNAYVLDLRADRMQILIDKLEITFSKFKEDVM
ncbi:MAG: hypothetical protein H8D47_02375 [Planctomycetes bacterium]|nr:hypothetical protein [Planctomycetota bacterium]